MWPCLGPEPGGLCALSSVHLNVTASAFWHSDEVTAWARQPSMEQKMLASSGRWASWGPCQQIPNAYPLCRPRPAPKFILVTRMITPRSTGGGQRSFRAGDRGSRCSGCCQFSFLFAAGKAAGCAAVGMTACLPPSLLRAVRAGLGTGVAPPAWAGAEALALLGP